MRNPIKRIVESLRYRDIGKLIKSYAEFFKLFFMFAGVLLSIVAILLTTGACVSYAVPHITESLEVSFEFALLQGLGITAFYVMCIFACVLFAFIVCVASYFTFIPLYAFGELIDTSTKVKENTDLLTRNIREEDKHTIEEARAAAEKERRAREEARAAAERNRRARQQAAALAHQEEKQPEQKTERQPERKAEEHAPKKAPMTLSDKLAYALRYTTNDGIIGYLKGVDDPRVQEILEFYPDTVREEIQKLLETL